MKKMGDVFITGMIIIFFLVEEGPNATFYQFCLLWGMKLALAILVGVYCIIKGYIYIPMGGENEELGKYKKNQ